MAVQKINAGTNEDGSPRWHYYAPDEHVVITGPITGSVTLPDGTTYDVSPDVIVVAAEHRLAVSDAIGQRYADEGHASHKADQPFVHTPSHLTHTKSGAASEPFAAAVLAAAPAGGDSSPSGVIDSLKKKG